MTNVDSNAKEVPITDFATYAKRRAWFVVLLAGLVLFGVVAVSAVHNDTTYSRTTHFVLHPDADTPAADVPPALDVLDGPLVQTVLRVLNNDEILRRSAEAENVTSFAGISLDTTVRPGSAYFDATVRGSERSDVDAVSRGFIAVAPRYIDGSYPGYNLSILGTDSTRDRPFPPSAAAVLLSLVFGALLGIALLFLDWSVHRLAVSTGAAQLAVPEPEPVPEPVAVASEASEAKPAARKPRTTKPRARKATGATKATAATKAAGATKQTRTRSTRNAKASSEPQTELLPPDLPDQVNGNGNGYAPAHANGTSAGTNTDSDTSGDTSADSDIGSGVSADTGNGTSTGTGAGADDNTGTANATDEDTSTGNGIADVSREGTPQIDDDAPVTPGP